MVLGQDIWSQLPRGNAARVVVLVWLVFAFMFATLYRGTLTAFLSVPKYPPRPENMDQLAQTGVRVKFIQNATRFLTYFQESELPAYRSVASRVDIIPSVMHGLNIISQENVAFFHERHNTQLLIGENFSGDDGTSNLYVAKENVIPNYAAWLLPHDAPYKTDMDRCIIRIIESGLKEKFTDDMMHEAWQEVRQKRKTKEKQQQVDGLESAVENLEVDEGKGYSSIAQRPLNMTQLQGAFWLEVFGLMLATFAFLLEIVSAKILLKRNPPLNLRLSLLEAVRPHCLT